jgi:hypothetical protein
MTAILGEVLRIGHVNTWKARNLLINSMAAQFRAKPQRGEWMLSSDQITASLKGSKPNLAELV